MTLPFPLRNWSETLARKRCTRSILEEILQRDALTTPEYRALGDVARLNN